MHGHPFSPAEKKYNFSNYITLISFPVNRSSSRVNAGMESVLCDSIIIYHVITNILLLKKQLILLTLF